MDGRKVVDIYIDTSIKGPKRQNGAALFILAFVASTGKTADRGQWIQKEDTTENHLTLLALEAALKHLIKACYLVIHLECSYVAAAIQNGWLQDWQKNGWQTAKKKPVRDAEIWQSILSLLEKHEFEVELGKEHTYRAWMKRELERKRQRKGEHNV